MCHSIWQLCVVSQWSRRALEYVSVFGFWSHLLEKPHSWIIRFETDDHVAIWVENHGQKGSQCLVIVRELIFLLTYISPHWNGGILCLCGIRGVKGSSIGF